MKVWHVLTMISEKLKTGNVDIFDNNAIYM